MRKEPSSTPAMHVRHGSLVDAGVWGDSLEEQRLGRAGSVACGRRQTGMRVVAVRITDVC